MAPTSSPSVSVRWIQLAKSLFLEVIDPETDSLSSNDVSSSVVNRRDAENFLQVLAWAVSGEISELEFSSLYDAWKRRLSQVDTIRRRTGAVGIIDESSPSTRTGTEEQPDPLFSDPRNDHILLPRSLSSSRRSLSHSVSISSDSNLRQNSRDMKEREALSSPLSEVDVRASLLGREESDLDLMIGLLINEHNKELCRMHSSPDTIGHISSRWVTLIERLFFRLDAAGRGYVTADEIFVFVLALFGAESDAASESASQMSGSSLTLSSNSVWKAVFSLCREFGIRNGCITIRRFKNYFANNMYDELTLEVLFDRLNDVATAWCNSLPVSMKRSIISTDGGSVLPLPRIWEASVLEAIHTLKSHLLDRFSRSLLFDSFLLTDACSIRYKFLSSGEDWKWTISALHSFCDQYSIPINVHDENAVISNPFFQQLQQTDLCLREFADTLVRLVVSFRLRGGRLSSLGREEVMPLASSQDQTVSPIYSGSLSVSGKNGSLSPTVSPVLFSKNDAHDVSVQFSSSPSSDAVSTPSVQQSSAKLFRSSPVTSREYSTPSKERLRVQWMPGSVDGGFDNKELEKKLRSARWEDIEHRVRKMPSSSLSSSDSSVSLSLLPSSRLPSAARSPPDHKSRSHKSLSEWWWQGAKNFKQGDNGETELEIRNPFHRDSMPISLRMHASASPSISEHNTHDDTKQPSAEDALRNINSTLNSNPSEELWMQVAKTFFESMSSIMRGSQDVPVSPGVEKGHSSTSSEYRPQTSRERPITLSDAKSSRLSPLQVANTLNPVRPPKGHRVVEDTWDQIHSNYEDDEYTPPHQRVIPSAHVSLVSLDSSLKSDASVLNSSKKHPPFSKSPQSPPEEAREKDIANISNRNANRSRLKGRQLTLAEERLLKFYERELRRSEQSRPLPKQQDVDRLNESDQKSPNSPMRAVPDSNLVRSNFPSSKKFSDYDNNKGDTSYVASPEQRVDKVVSNISSSENPVRNGTLASPSTPHHVQDVRAMHKVPFEEEYARIRSESPIFRAMPKDPPEQFRSRSRRLSLKDVSLPGGPFRGWRSPSPSSFDRDYPSPNVPLFSELPPSSRHLPPRPNTPSMEIRRSSDSTSRTKSKSKQNRVSGPAAPRSHEYKTNYSRSSLSFDKSDQSNDRIQTLSHHMDDPSSAGRGPSQYLVSDDSSSVGSMGNVFTTDSVVSSLDSPFLDVGLYPRKNDLLKKQGLSNSNNGLAKSPRKNRISTSRQDNQSSSRARPEWKS